VAADIALAASWAVLISGTMMPAAPASSARPIAVGLFSSIRTSPTGPWAASMAVSPATMPG